MASASTAAPSAAVRFFTTSCDVAAEALFPLLDPSSDALCLRLASATMARAFELFANVLPFGTKVLLDLQSIHIFRDPWRALRSFVRLYPNCRRIRLRSGYRISPMDIMCFTMLYPDANELDFGTFRGGLVGCKPAKELDTEHAISDNSESQGQGYGNGHNMHEVDHQQYFLHELRLHDGFLLQSKEWQRSLMAMGHQCFHLRRLVLAGPALGNLDEEIMLPFANSCSLLEDVEIGGGGSGTRISFLSLCGALRMWRRLRKFRFNGEISRGRWNPPRQEERQQHFEGGPEFLTELHFSCAVLTKAMLSYLFPVIARLHGLTIHVNNSDQVFALIDMGHKIQTKAQAQAASPGGASKYADSEFYDEGHGDIAQKSDNEDSEEIMGGIPSHRNRHQRQAARRRRRGRGKSRGRYSMSGLSLDRLCIIKPPGYAPHLKSDAIAKLVGVCPKLRHLYAQGLHELDRQLFTALVQKDGPGLESLMLPGYLNWRSSVDRGLARLVSTFGCLSHVSLSNLSDISVQHLVAECGHTLQTLHALHSSNITDKSLASLGGACCPHLHDLVLDCVDVSTSSILSFLEKSHHLRRLYLANRSPIISDASLIRILQIGAKRCLSHLWLTNTLTTDSLVDLMAANTSARNNPIIRLPGPMLQELFLSEFQAQDASHLSDLWPSVRVVSPREVFYNASREPHKGSRVGMYEETRSGVLQQWLRMSALSGLSIPFAQGCA